MTLYEEIDAVANGLPGAGRLGVAARLVDAGGEELLYRPDDVFPTASVIKALILVATYEAERAGRLRLDDRIPLTREMRVEGSGVLLYCAPGIAPTIGDLTWLMMSISDNVATNMLIDLLGIEAINGVGAALGLERTTLHRPISFDAPGHFAETSPRDMLRLFAHIDAGTAVDAAACTAMLEILKECQSKDGIPRYLPIHDTDDDETAPVEVAHKTGSINGVRNDAGIVYLNRYEPPRRYILSIFTADVDDDRLWTPENAASRAVAEVSRLVYRHYERVLESR
jgi:beta-lactamase class A